MEKNGIATCHVLVAKWVPTTISIAKPTVILRDEITCDRMTILYPPTLPTECMLTRKTKAGNPESG